VAVAQLQQGDAGRIEFSHQFEDDNIGIGVKEMDEPSKFYAETLGMQLGEEIPRAPGERAALGIAVFFWRS